MVGYRRGCGAGSDLSGRCCLDRASGSMACGGCITGQRGRSFTCCIAQKCQPRCIPVSRATPRREHVLSVARVYVGVDLLCSGCRGAADVGGVPLARGVLGWPAHLHGCARIADSLGHSSYVHIRPLAEHQHVRGGDDERVVWRRLCDHHGSHRSEDSDEGSLSSRQRYLFNGGAHGSAS